MGFLSETILKTAFSIIAFNKFVFLTLTLKYHIHEKEILCEITGDDQYPNNQMIIFQRKIQVDGPTENSLPKIGS